MKLKKGFVIRKIGSDTIAIFAGGDTVDLQQAIELNETAELIFEKLLEGADERDLIDALTQKYEISKEKAEQDVKKFISALAEKDFLS